MAVTLRLVRILVASGIIISAAVSGDADTLPSPQRGVGTKSLGDLDLRTPVGEQVSLIPFITRKAVVVVFWAAWCPVCQSEVPRLNQLNTDPRVKVIAVNEGDSGRKIKSFIAAYNVGYQVVVDPDGAVAKTFQVPGMPSCVIIGRSGLVVYRGSELPRDMNSYLEQ